MDRLTHKARHEAGYKVNRGKSLWECVDKLGKLEDMEEQGKLLELPCAAGDMTYWADKNQNKVRDFFVEKIEIEPEGVFVITSGPVHHANEFGKTVFLTQEEAEAALKVMGERQI